MGGNRVTPEHARLLQLLTKAGIPWRQGVFVPRPGEYSAEMKLKSYELDCLCWEKVIAEADGPVHWKSVRQRKHDEERDAFFERYDYITLRFRNKMIMHNGQEVIATILQYAPEGFVPQ